MRVIVVKLLETLIVALFATAAYATPPNVLVILIDDMGYSDPSFMGGEVATPAIDRLAGEGVRFTQCYNSARCCPSRASLMTGLYPHQAGIGSFTSSRPDPKGPAYLGRLNDECVTIAEVLRPAGYRTYMVGKWHMGDPGPIARGFDEFYGFVHGYEQDQWEPSRYERLPEGRTPELAFDRFYATDAFTEYALEFIHQARAANEAGEDKPWFLYLAHSAAHFPVQAPKETVDELVEAYRAGWDELRRARFERMQALGLADDTWTFTERSVVPVDRDDIANGYSGEPNPAWSTLPADRREDLARRMAIYAAMLTHADRGLARIIADLEAGGELDNTIIFLMSDNGACYEWGPFGFDGPSREGVTKLHTGDELETMGGPGTYHAYGSAWANLCNTPLRMYKHFTYEGGNCTPMVVHWPTGSFESRWERTPVHVMDILPTIADACGAAYPDVREGRATTPVEGTSLMPLLRGGSIADRPIASEHNGARSLRHGDWKAVWPERMPWEQTWELYNIADDRTETRNVAGEHPEIAESLAAEWTAWAARCKVYPVYDHRVYERRPEIAGRALVIEATIKLPTQTESGVIVAQGGSTHGYALYLDRGRLVFCTRREGELTTTPPYTLGATGAQLRAMLDADGLMTLFVDREPVAQVEGGLIPAEPAEPLDIGADEGTAVGTYDAPSALRGEVSHVSVNGQRFEREAAGAHSER